MMLEDEDSSVTPVRIYQTTTHDNRKYCNLSAFDSNQSISFALNMSNLFVPIVTAVLG